MSRINAAKNTTGELPEIIMDKYTQLEKLAELKTKGILTDAEYDEQKAKLLAQRVPTLHTGTAQPTVVTETLSPYWQNEFARIDEIGLPAYKKFNWPAFFFVWIWAFTKGLWQNALVTLGIIFAATLIDIAIDNPALSRALNIGFGIGYAIMYGTNANKWYYRKAVKGEMVVY
jgi:hypothetical protein